MKADWCTPHDQPRSSCRPDQAHKWSLFVRSDLMAAAERRAMEEGISLNKLITRSLEHEIGFTLPPPTVKGNRLARLPGVNAAADGYEVENRDDGAIVLHPASPAEVSAAEFSAEYARLQAERAGRAAALSPKDEAFVRALEYATEGNPATAGYLRAITGTESSNSYIPKRLAIVKRAGVVGWRPAPDYPLVYWWGLPGADIRAALRGKTAESHQEAPDGQSPAPAPRRRSAQATRTGKGRNAATKETPRKRRTAVREQAPAATRRPVAADRRESVITELRNRIPGVVPASELTVAAPMVFQPPEGDREETAWYAEEPTDKTAKPGRQGKPKCGHYVPAGTRCKLCPQPE